MVTQRTDPPRTGRHVSPRAYAFVVVLVVYVLYTLAVIYKSPVLELDTEIRRIRRSMDQSWRPFVQYYVAFGQRGPSTLVFLPFFIWIAWRKRSAQPLVLLGTALIMLNLSVGIVKIITGRLGPRHTWDSHAIFAGGNIYPSGHVSNTVVLYGLIAWIALEYRRTLVVAAVWLSVSVGLGTVYLNTHWLSDIVGGWLAGALVLLALPWVMPSAERVVAGAVSWWRNRRGRGLAVVDLHGARSRVATPSHTTARHASVRTRTRTSNGTFAEYGLRARSQSTSTPVSSMACSQSFAATAVSLEAAEEPTRVGDPRNSPIPSGP